MINPSIPSESATRRKRVAVVDDHTMMRGGMKVFLDSLPDFECCWTAADGGEAMHLMATDPPDILFMDITLPDRNGLELVKDIHALQPELPILMVSMHDESHYAHRALKAGAKGYLMKNTAYDLYEKALHRLASGGTWLSEALSEQMVHAFTTGSRRLGADGLDALTDREFEIFQLIGEGNSTHEVASALRISPKTVDVHRMRIRSKLKLEDGAAVTRFAIRWMESRRLSST